MSPVVLYIERWPDIVTGPFYALFSDAPEWSVCDDEDTARLRLRLRKQVGGKLTEKALRFLEKVEAES